MGLDDDTNTNLTRRLLLLLESIAVLGQDVHRGCWERVLETYLERGTKDHRPPRFLLNDVVRYWRTMCVDFEGKHWTNKPHEKWVTRNAKLRTSRKILFAGGLVPILCCHGITREEQLDYLTRQYQANAVDRLAHAFLTVDDGAQVEAGIRGLQAYDRFVEMMSQPDVRAELRTLTQQDRLRSRRWNEIRSLGDEIQQSLLALLFGRDLSAVTRQYAIF